MSKEMHQSYQKNDIRFARLKEETALSKTAEFECSQAPLSNFKLSPHSSMQFSTLFDISAEKAVQPKNISHRTEPSRVRFQSVKTVPDLVAT